MNHLANELRTVAAQIEQSARNVAMAGPETRMAVKDPAYLADLLRRAAAELS